jgi:predicted phosphodiesterase
MPFTRRHFLALSSLTGLSLALLGRELPSNSAAPLPAVTTSPAARLEVPPEAVLLRFAATADAGSGDRHQFAIGQAMADYRTKNPYDLVVMAGDNIYNSGDISLVNKVFEQPYAALLKENVKFRACLGNHDARTDKGDPQVKYPGFHMDGRAYTYKVDPAEFFVLDTTKYVDWQNQLTWLEQQLKDSKAKMKIVYGHHPVYASGAYGTDPEMVARLSPLFKKYRVQLYINGHEHHYERTTSIDGTTYLITGHGGASLRYVGKSDFTAYALSRYGFSAVEIRQNSFSIAGIDSKGEVFDQATQSFFG